MEKACVCAPPKAHWAGNIYFLTRTIWARVWKQMKQVSVCAPPAAPGEREQQTENTFKPLKSEQTGGVGSAGGNALSFPCLLKRCLVARQLMAALKGVNFAQINLLWKWLWRSNTDPWKPPVCCLLNLILANSHHCHMRGSRLMAAWS